MKMLASLLPTLVLATSALAQPTAQLPDFVETLTQLAGRSSTGGAGSSNSPGVEIVTLMGNPERPGPYVQLLQAAPHTRIEAHRHAGDRVGTVLSGTWRFGYGTQFDQAKLVTLPVGSIYSEPAGRTHFAETSGEAVIVQITGNGPTDTVYQNPANDPAR